MPFADDVRNLARNDQARLTAAHDYYYHARMAWHNFADQINQGGVLALHNLVTGNLFDQRQLSSLIPAYLRKNLNESTFNIFLSIFEDFFFELIRIWLHAYPASLSEKMLKFSTVLKSADRMEVIESVIERELNEVKYQKVADWFAYLDKLARPGCPSPDEIDQIAERKAGRDVLAHNKGVVNAIYAAKSGKFARYRIDEILEIEDDYHHDTWQLLKKVIDDLAAAVIPKLPAP